MDFADLHTHILPGVDDGAASVDETVAMLQLAYDSGTRKIVATPHMFLDLFPNGEITDIRDHFDRMKEELSSLEDRLSFLKEIQVFLGAENHASPEFFEALDQGCVLSLNGSRYLLVEVPAVLPISQIRQVTSRVFTAGFTPVLAHAERWVGLRDDPMKLEEFWGMGCVVQVNASSFFGSSGPQSEKCAWKLMKEGLVDVIATDGHRIKWRRPTLEKIFLRLMEEYQEEDVGRWLHQTPSLILANETLEAETRS